MRVSVRVRVRVRVWVEDSGFRVGVTDLPEPLDHELDADEVEGGGEEEERHVGQQVHVHQEERHLRCDQHLRLRVRG